MCSLYDVNLNTIVLVDCYRFKRLIFMFDYHTRLLLLVITCLILLATGMHLINESRSMSRTTNNLSIVAEPLWSRTITTTDTSVSIKTSSVAALTDEREQSMGSDEATLLTNNTSTKSIDLGKLNSTIDLCSSYIHTYDRFVVVAQKLILCCSFVHNYRLFTSESYPKNLACLNGIRVLSFVWIVLVHTVIFAVYYSGE
jgi:hypothetical protein